LRRVLGSQSVVLLKQAVKKALAVCGFELHRKQNTGFELHRKQNTVTEFSWPQLLDTPRVFS
jgi:hypothetical protein